jgi:hypothetical protein
MPVLDAKALRTDRKGLAFLRAVLGLKRPKKRPPVPGTEPAARAAKEPGSAETTVRRPGP